MYLSFSGYQCANKCLLLYWHTYENHTNHGQPDDRLGSIYGSAVGRIFELFYEKGIWKNKGSREVLIDMVEDVVDQLLKEALEPRKGRPGGVIMWRGEDEGQNPRGMYYNRMELIRDVKSTITGGLKTIKENTLLSNDARAEFRLDSEIEGHKIVGIADFLMTRYKIGDRVIVDGKGTQHAVFSDDGKYYGKYTDPEQLDWYSMLHREKFGTLPDKVAFLYWRYEPPANLKWVGVEEKDVDAMKTKLLDTIKKLEELGKELAAPENKVPLKVVQEVYTPSATQQNCQFCPYATEELCPEGYLKREQIQKRYESQR